MRFSWTVLVLALIATAAQAQDDTPRPAPTTVIAVHALPDAASPQAGFNAEKATNAYLAEVSGAARARSDAYFDGGQILRVVDGLYAVAVAALLLWLRISARMRDWAARITGSPLLQVPVYVVLYLILTTAMSFPLSVYEDFFREHAYGLSHQDFAGWLRDFATSFAVSLVGLVVLLSVVYALIRHARKTWWIWATLATVLFLSVQLFISPVFIAPLYNHYRPLNDGPLKTRIVSLARSEGIPATDIYEFDASRQTTRISANVSGLFGTTRISLNDNLLKRCTPDEVMAIVGHEMGHYILNHAALLITWLGLLILAGFAFADRGFRCLLDMFGGDWQVRGIEDPAGLPVLAALLSVFMLIATPVLNTIIRTAEAQADIFGINAVRQPDAFASVALKLADYRKLDPAPWEEILLYDHPSGRSRIAMAMRWKAGHLDDLDIKNGPVSPQ